MMRIAVIQVGMPLQSCTRDLIKGLSTQGCMVELLTHEKDFPGFVDAGSLSIPIHFLRTGHLLTFLHRFSNKIAQLFDLPFPIHRKWVHAQARQHLAQMPQYDLLIGVEKAGLEIAAQIGADNGIPFIYFSLELYLEDHPDLHRFRWQRRSEIRCHRQATATIIQDKYRWNCLRHANLLINERVFFLPVGLPHRLVMEMPSVMTPSPEAPLKLLYLGMISRTRFADHLMNVAASLPKNTRLHLHGPVHKTEQKWLQDQPTPSNLTITSNLLDEKSLLELIAKADIGLAFYRRDYANDRLTAFSSQKIALYLQAGIPIITFRSESYEELFRQYPCGEMIESFDDLPLAIERIQSRRSEYAAAALSAFTAIYELDAYWSSLARFLVECTADAAF